MQYTWHRKNPVRCARLDYFLISESLTDLVDKCYIKPGYRSDHSIVVLTIKICKFKRGRGTWKFNCSLLKDKEYLITINNLIDREKLNYALPVYHPHYVTTIHDNDLQFTISDSIFLETLLLQIRGETIKYSTKVKKQTICTEENLKREIEILENNYSQANLEELEMKKKELENLRKVKMNGMMVRSRAQWLIDGERPSKYFCSLEKFYNAEKTVKKVCTDSGAIVTSQKEILSEIRHYYSDLFRNRDTNLIESDLNEIGSIKRANKLSDHDSKTLEGLLTIEELGSALKSMKNKKSPGIDGFPAEFYKIFWVKLKFFVLRSLNSGFHTGEMSSTLRQCIITCLPKGDKPRQFLKNWRPISLLSVVYKIASSALAKRLHLVLDQLISNTQSGFMQGRFIGENTRLIYDIMHYTNKYNIDGLLVLIDFQKAFDSVSWSFMQKTLKFFGFKEDFCRWIKVLNTNIKASVQQCGILSETFDIERGCRQGDPISSFLFLLCAEIMFLMLSNNASLKGITIDGIEYKISQFADDTTLILDGTKSSLLTALNILEIFGSMSGLKINTDKTKLIWIGKKRKSKDKLEIGRNFLWGAETFNLLGIHFTNNLDDIIELNYPPVIESLKKLFHQWNKRYLSPLGRIAVIKTFALSKLNHLLLSLPLPAQKYMKRIESMFYKFIWDNKPDKVKRSTLTKDFLHGGLNMIDLNNFASGLKITWIRRMYKNPDLPWVSLAKTYVGPIRKIFMLGSTYSLNLARNINNKFWAEILNCWSQLTRELPSKNMRDPLSIPMWYNPSISKSELFFPNWYSKGVISVSDLLSSDGQIISIQDLKSGYNIKTNFLEYHRVTSNLQVYLSKLQSFPAFHVKPTFHSQIYTLTKSKRGSKDFYSIFQTNCIENETKSYYSFWENSLKTKINKEMWLQTYKNCFKTIHDNEIKWFQYRILHRILGTKEYLFKIKYKNDNVCVFCKQNVETIMHLFVDCNVVKNFWSEIKRNVSLYLGLELALTPQDIILGVLKATTTTTNIIYLTAKAYIFQTARSNGILIFQNYCQFIKNIYIEQEFASKLEINHTNFVKVWGKINLLFV